MRSSDFSKLWQFGKTLLVLAAFLPEVATAQCFVCDEVVELDTKLARCFQQDYEKNLQAARTSATTNAEVNLADCAGMDGRERRGIDKMPSIPRSNQPSVPLATTVLRSVYILDAASIVCLKELLDERADNLDPSVSFDLEAECKP